MFFQQIYDKTLAQASYLIGCQAKNVAIVIDAKRDIDTYVQVAQQNNLTITHLTETHIHADFLSGTRELAEVTEAEMYLSAEGGEGWTYEFPHTPLHNGSVISVGNLTFEVMHTPGHTPESISFILRDHPASDEPVMVFTGDFVFVGDIGRPDLLENAAGLVGTKEIGAKQMYESLKKFAALPDFVQVWPGHGAGSACGKSLGAVPSSTVGYEKIRNWAFQYNDDFDGFKDYLLDEQPAIPAYFATMKKLNKSPRVLRPEIVIAPTTAVNDIDFDRENLIILDTRSKKEFAKGHLPRSLNIQNNNSLANWAGWFVDYNTSLVVVVDAGQQENVTRKLMRIGLDNIEAFVTDFGSIPLDKAHIVEAEQVEAMSEDSEIVILDVRTAKEYREGHIPGSKNYFIGNLKKSLPPYDRDKKIVISCQSGDRATIASSFLKRNGFKNVMNYAGSFNDWREKGKGIIKE